jgi:hypothetical protein
MAQHNSTPRGVLNAPQPTVEWVSVQRGYSRDERRHGVRLPERMTNEAKAAVHAEASTATNTTHVRITPRRGRKVAR